MAVLLSVLDSLADPINKIQTLGPTMAYLFASRKDLGKVPSKEELIRLKIKIEDLIVNSCSNCDFERAHEYYRKSFEFEKSLAIDYVNGVDKRPSKQIFAHTATTNYDLVLERYERACEIDIDRFPSKHFLRRGFKRPYDEAELCLRPGLVNENVEYLKLHGSIDWWIRERGNTIVVRESQNSLMGETYHKRLIIYPVYEKIVSTEPFISLYDHFRRFLTLHDAYVVVGYSFRDQSINDAFKNALQNETKRMVIVNSNLERIRNRLRDFPLERIDTTKHHFGDVALLKELDKILRKKPIGIDKRQVP
jgi:hypothetical protein